MSKSRGEDVGGQLMAPGIARVGQAQARCFRVVASCDVVQRAVLPVSCQRLKKAH
jgi:hypothetical protein